MTSETLPLIHGDNGVQEYWAVPSQIGVQVDFFRNHTGDLNDTWFAYYQGELLSDPSRKRSKAVVILCAGTAQELAKKVERIKSVTFTFLGQSLPE
jgi:hypothetical protein